MKKQLIIIGVVAILVTVGLSGCNQESNPLTSDKDKFVGTWEGEEKNIVVYYSNGTLTTNGGMAIWEIKDGLLVIESGNISISLSYKFSNDDKTLVFTNPESGITAIYTKQ